MFNHLLCNDVKVQKISGYDDYDNPIIDEEITIKGKIELEYKTIKTKNGSEVVANGELRVNEQLSELDKVNVGGVWRDILNIIPQDDFSGKVLYYVVYF